MNSAAASRFLTDRVITASPAQRVVMLYDRAILDLDRALAARDGERFPDASTQVMHALAVVSELSSSLDPSAFEGGPGLADLYAWCVGELLDARDGQHLDGLAAVRTVLSALRDAWAIVAGEVATAPAISRVS